MPHLHGLPALNLWGRSLRSFASALCVVCVLWAGLHSPGAAAGPMAQAWPSQPLKLVVGFAPGSSPDITARTLAGPLSQALGQPVVVDNKPGAGGNIAAAAVAHARDGHTLGLMINGNLTIAKILNPQTPYDPLKDLAPVSLLVTAPLVLVVPANQPADPAAWLAGARQASSAWNHGSPGVGTVAHLGLELLKARSGLASTHVPYGGNPQVINAMLAGDIHMALLPPGLAMAQVRAGKLRAVGITSGTRSSLLPEVPTLAQLGVRDFELEVWNAVAAPVSMPAAHTRVVAQALSDIVRRPEVRQALFNQGWQVVGSAPQGLARRIQTDTARLSAIIRTQGIETR